MAINYNKKNKLFTLETETSSYQMKVSEYGHLLHLYYGARCSQDTSHLLDLFDRGFSGNPNDADKDRTYSLDYLPQEYPTLGTGDYRINGMIIGYPDGTNETELKFKDYKITEGKYSLPGLPSLYDNENEVSTLEIRMTDDFRMIEITLIYGVFYNENIITRAVKIVNQSEQTCYIHKVMSTTLDWVYGEYDWISLYGRHAMDRIPQRNALKHGIQGIRSSRGMSSHQYNPFVILADTETTEDYGDCYGFSFAYSGNFIAEIERSQYDGTRFTMGISPEGFNYELACGQVFHTPEVIMSHSIKGLTKLSHQYHHILRNNMCRGSYKYGSRPVLINNWEGTYFDFDGDKLYKLAKEASQQGIDLFVLDDGWFGKRDDDFSGLGDWSINEEKLGGPLNEFIDRLNKLGMGFGLWFEPEMISEDSDLYREHPDWALKIPGKNPIRSRYQLVLDFSRKEVVDHIYENIKDILDHHDINYIKWDFNRCLTDVYSVNAGKNQGAVSHKYVLGLYDILERINKRYPDLLIESCSGGGGRFDAGMLHYSSQIWGSDNTDAIDRTIIQEGTTYGYPVSSIGAHVSVTPNHQTGRTTPLETRAVVAMSGSFGYELDINNMSELDKEKVKKQVETYKKHQNLIYEGLYYRLSTSMVAKPYAAWMFVSEDMEEALLNVVVLEAHGNPVTNYVKLKGLKPDKTYMEMDTKAVYTGELLMNAGIKIPVSEQYNSKQLFFKAI